MLIRQIEIFKSRIKLLEPFKISLGILDHAENVIVRITTDNGFIGFGECSPFKTINGESMDTGFIVGQYLGKVLIGKNPLDIEDCISLMNKVIYGNSSIKSAFDIALYDIASQHAKLPLYKFLGGNNYKEIVTDYTISIDRPEKMAEDAVEIKNKGFNVIKVKLGGTREEDSERIKQIRDKIGYDIPLRIDANQGWNCKTALEILKNLESYNIQHCEEPIPRWDFMNLPFLKKNSLIPIMADESCCDHNDAARLIDLNACHRFNIKLGKSSGIFNALKIIKLAEKADIPMQIGGFLESRLGFTASAHLSLSNDQIRYFDFDTPLMFEEDPVKGGMTYGKNGLITLPETIGLGAFIDESYLENLPKILIQ
ncbi:mandelate racemase/muconate lactonizing enzyme family protein [Sporocytophaga myxococcoides]|uniref:mandelate racemase/muconate lactonizing enzyme family protein n=1 Tax=Sporocytophaga myxococcoides TaxID=153721 RepID=UPI00040C8729|nr:dipeptide epimerase [Sporocytophaga myxococcoides]